MLGALSIQVPEYAAYDAAFRAYQKLDLNNNDVPADVAEAALALVRETHAVWKAAAERKAGIGTATAERLSILNSR
jgi:hypothetical protein